MTVALDGSVAVSSRRFGDAVRSFCDRRPVWDGAVARWEPPVYGRMRSALTGRSAVAGRRMASSRAPLRMVVLDWLHQVDGEVARWGPGAGTVHVLQALAARSYRPQDCHLLDGWSDQLAVWATEAATVLGDGAVVVPLRNVACPACGDRWASRHRDGETLRSPALMVSELGAECHSCLAAWGVEQFDWLARLLDEG